MKPNEEFKLSVRDIETIEHALRDRMRKVSLHRLTIVESTIKAEEELESVKLCDQELAELNDLLARLHNQKEWPRFEKRGTYISG